MNYKIVLIMCIVVFLLILLILKALIYISKNCLKIKKYTVKNDKIPKDFNGYKIVHLTDVHSKIYGENNIEVISKIKSINPDIVVMTGDIISQCEKDIDRFISMYKDIYINYPTYYSIGNHERKLGIKKYKYYLNQLSKLGVHVIVNGTEKIYKGDSYVVINALKFRENMQSKVLTEERREKYIKYMKNKLDRVQENEYNILLAHDPENFKLYKELGVDLVLSGHVHGGLIRIGKICLLSPRRKFFPKYAYGMTKEENTTIITSSGMGAARLDIRLFNRPELVEIKLVSSV